MNWLHALVCLCVPAVANWSAHRFTWAKTLGPVVLSYAAGIIFGNLPGVRLDEELGQSIAGGAVLLAVPLLLFTTDLKGWLKLARPLVVSFVLACVAAVVAAAAVAWVFRARTDEWWKIAGMLVGVYVGGTANMSAVGLALETRQETFVVLNTADLVCGGAYLFFLLGGAKRLLSRFLKPFSLQLADTAMEVAPGPSSLSPLVSKAAAFALTLAMVALSVGLSFLTAGKLHIGVVMLSITTLGIAASLVPAIRNLRGSYELGEYLLLIFCTGMGALADASRLSGSSVMLLSFVALVMVSAAALHFALCRLFGIDVDTAIISSTATIFGPPFIGPVATALGNRQLVGPGLTLGLMGIALGTYLGLATSWALHAIN